MNKGIIKCLKNSISEKGNYCYSLPVETTKAVIKELNRLNNIINELESYLEQQWLEWKDDYDDGIVAMANEDKTVLDKLKELKENNNV